MENRELLETLARTINKRFVQNNLPPVKAGAGFTPEGYRFSLRIGPVEITMNEAGEYVDGWSYPAPVRLPEGG